MQIDALLSESWEIYRRFFSRFVIIAAVVFVGVQLISTLLLSANDGSGFSDWILAVAAAVVSIIGTFLLQGALVEATDDLRDGRADMEIADLFRSARPVLPSLILTGIVSAFIIGIGFLFLVIPGLIAMTFLAFVVPVVVKERASVGTAISRSISLVQGNFWSVFGLLLVLFIALVIVSGVLNWLVTAVVSGILGEWLANVISSVVCIPFFAVAITMAYFHLTEREPGTR
ncbi:MAG: hypothetical protein H6531_00930 [Actinobacteria bacterium]|nr:hypothetical protein [Thermoleophilia bacterium]MCB9010376.1 hypothetical protein [Actinomycetota bacterium]